MAILTTAGPVSTYKAVQYTRKSLHCMKGVQFTDAASELQQSNLGLFVKLQSGSGSASNVFIKKPPDEVEEALLPYIDLCNLDKYRERYHMPASKSISFTLRTRLVAAKLVSERLFI